VTTTRAKRPPSKLRGVVELVLTVAVAVGVALLIQATLVKPYKIPSASMEPTLSIGQRVVVNRLDTHPSLGNIVVFHPPVGADTQQCGDQNQGTNHRQACDRPTAPSSETFIKRVVGLPGDRISIVNGHVIRDGTEEKAPYAAACGGGPDCNFPTTITIPPGHYFMMGDNRGDSDDSRFWGPIPQSSIIGVAFFTYWPIHRIGTL
jgi:signal peptidase I